jgi:hypothetical protein
VDKAGEGHGIVRAEAGELAAPKRSTGDVPLADGPLKPRIWTPIGKNSKFSQKKFLGKETVAQFS